MRWWGSVVVLLVVLGLALYGMRHGWRARAQRTAGWVPALPSRPDDLRAERLAPVEATYVSSTRAGEPLERVAAHDLGVRSSAVVHVHDTGVLVERTGAQDLFVPAADLRAVGTAPGMAGKVVGGAGLVVLTWQADGAQIDTGLRLRHRADQPTLLAAVASLLAPALPPTGTETPMTPAKLVLEDGRTFAGEAYGAVGSTVGEIVFNTGMTGYQETLTDPSYHRQIVVMTAPHIGNTGVNDDDPESTRIWVAGYVVRDPARRPSSWRSRRPLADDLRDQRVVGISDIDTRALTRHLRERGVMRAGIFSGDALDGRPTDELLALVRQAPAMTGADLAREVSTPRPYVVAALGEDGTPLDRPVAVVAAVDLGIKSMTPRRLAERGVEVHVLPVTSRIEDVLAIGADGVFFSNGPGDPAAAVHEVELLRQVLDRRIPFFGICYGNQLFGRALGFGTYKLVYGHRGVNQPVVDRTTGKVEITAHNHGFAVDAPLEGPTMAPYEGGRYGRVLVSHVDLNDDVVEGLSALDLPAFSVQYHPEAAAGPHDAAYLFDRFVALMREHGPHSQEAA